MRISRIKWCSKYTIVRQKWQLFVTLCLCHAMAGTALSWARCSLHLGGTHSGEQEEEVSRCQRSEGSCAVLFVDLDHFKQVNDTWGHRAGDAILREVGSRLRTSSRLQDFVGRYGGEEFAIVLTDVDLDGASQTAER